MIASLTGVGLLLIFMVQNTEDVTLNFLVWSFIAGGEVRPGVGSQSAETVPGQVDPAQHHVSALNRPANSSRHPRRFPAAQRQSRSQVPGLST